MKQFLHTEYKSQNLMELKAGIGIFWKSLTPDVCTRYINHIHTVIPVVIEKNGDASGVSVQ